MKRLYVNLIMFYALALTHSNSWFDYELDKATVYILAFLQLGTWITVEMIDN